MNLIVASINFKPISKTNCVKQNANKNTFERNILLEQDAALALKNQVLFKSNPEKTKRNILIQDAIKTYNLNIKPEIFDFIFNLDNARSVDGEYEKYFKAGYDFFAGALRAKFHKEYPHKFVHELKDLEAIYGESVAKSRVLKTLFNCELLPNRFKEEPRPQCFSRVLLALIGAMALENDENALKNANEFLNNHVMPLLVPEGEEISNNYFEDFKEYIESKGLDYDDIYIQRKVVARERQYYVWYKDILLSQNFAMAKQDSFRQEAVEEAILKIESGEVDLSKATDELPYIKFKYPSGPRIEKLNFFKKKYGLEFDDMTLLNQVFLFGSMSDDSTVLRTESNQPLEYIGMAVLNFCIDRGYRKNHPDMPEHQLKERINAFSSQDNLAKVSKNMMLWKYCDNNAVMGDSKQQAGILRALIGAIYLKDGENGLESAYKFIEDNFSAELFGKENVEVKSSTISQEEAQEKWQKAFELHSIPRWQRIKKYTPPKKISLSKKEAIEDVIKKYDLKLPSQIISYIFNRESINDELYDRYFNIGKLVYAIHARQSLNEQHPFKNPWQLTKIEQEGRNNQIAKTVRKMFNKSLIDDGNKSEKQPMNMYFFALLGAIVEKGGMDGNKNVMDFLNNHAKSQLIKNAPYQSENENELLNKEIIKMGYNPDDLFIESKFDGAKCVNKIYYQDRFVTKIITPGKNGLRFAYETALREAVLNMRNGVLNDLDSLEKVKVNDYRKADEFRKAKLQKLCDKYNIQIKDYNLLNKAFLQGKTRDDIQIQYHDSYESLEYIGDAVLEYCVHNMIASQKANYNWDEVTHKLHRFTCNANLAKIGTRMKLDKYLLIPGHVREIKRYADLFEALIAAIYLDDKEHGLDNVYKFLEENFKDEILNI